MARVAVLGCGPAGLLAAHAVALCGHEPVIYSKKVKPNPSGAQFIDRRIWDVPGDPEPFPIIFKKYGDGDTYTRNLYHDQPLPVRSSWHNYQHDQIVQAWSIKEIIEALWGLYSDHIYELDLSAPGVVESLRRDYHDSIISTIPRWALEGGTAGGGEFPYRSIWVAPAPFLAEAGGEECSNDHDDWVSYLGLEDPSGLYRSSFIRGVGSMEFTVPPFDDGGMMEDAIEIKKPTYYAGNDPYPGILKVGRYGAWSKMQLASHAFFNTIQWCRPDMDVRS